MAERYDVLVLGGGTAGCVVAARLSEEPARSVCLIEAGPDPGPLDGGGWPRELLDARTMTDAYDWLWREGARGPKLLSIGLHLRIIGRPGRIAALEQVLTHISGREGVWIARRADIAGHWRGLHGLEP